MIQCLKKCVKEKSVNVVGEAWGVFLFEKKGDSIDWVVQKSCKKEFIWVVTEYINYYFV